MGNIKLFELKYVPKMTVDYSKYSDKDILALCQKYGTQTILWRQRFIGLLPEVDCRKLYLKKGFSSIVEFGKRMAGLSEAQIRLAINLEKKFEDKPLLHEALVKGKISMNKLVRVASIATAENEWELAKYAKVLSKASLDVLVRDIKQSGTKWSFLSEHDENGGLRKDGMRIENGFLEPRIDVKSLPGHTEAKRRYLSEHDETGNGLNPSDGAEGVAKLNFQLNPEVIRELNALHEKGIDVNEIILRMLEKREEEIANKKEGISRKVALREAEKLVEGKDVSRYIGVKTQRILKEEYGTKCSVTGCVKAMAHLHHTVPFSIGKSNAPDLLKPLCREHHDILHSVNESYLNMKFRN